MLNKIRNVIIDKKLIMHFLLIFIAIEPLIDFYLLFDEKYSFMGFAIPTIIRIIGILILGLMFLFCLKRKELALYITYTILIIVYVLFHHLNALNFTDYYGGFDFNYSFLSEIFYIIRMLMPLAIIAISSHQKISDEKLNNLVFILVLIICGSIILTNLFNISTGSYSKTTIKGNFFCWFKENRCNLTYYDLASKGFFKDANRIAALLVLITPLSFYCYLKKSNLKNIIMLILNMLGMLILGTKVSTYGFLIITILSIGVYLYFSFIKKEYHFTYKIIITLSILALSNILLISYSPAVNRTSIDNQNIADFNANIDGKYEEEQQRLQEMNNLIIEKYYSYNKLNKDDSISLNVIEMLESLPKEIQNALVIPFIKNNYEEFKLNSDFINISYPYQKNPVFWYKIMNEPLENRVNYRFLEQSILGRIKEKNNNYKDNYLGITFTRMSNIFDLERDFISHYYTLGLFGIILLLLPYIAIIIICGLKILLNYQKHFTSQNIFYIISLGITLFAAYFSGNVLDGLVVSLVIGFISGQLINKTFFIEEQNL